jgi:hypothetical protein
MLRKIIMPHAEDLEILCLSKNSNDASSEQMAEFSQTYRLHSLIFPVSSSSCLDCLLESLILSIFWNPFLQKRKPPVRISQPSKEASQA